MSALAAPANLQAVLLEHFGHPAFHPGQREVIELILDGHSAAAVFPTGGGKSLCCHFQRFSSTE